MKIREGYKIEPLSIFEISIFRDGRNIGIFRGYNMHPAVKTAWFLEEMIWLSGSSPRERLEAVCFFVKSGVKSIGASRKKDFEFFKKISKDGHLRKVGISHHLFEDESAMLWETC